MAVKLEIKKGKDLTSHELDIINDARKKEFNSTSMLAPVQGNEDWNKLYFLLRDDNTLLAFARLHEVTIEFDAKQYEVLGFATLISLCKGEGYGAKLVQEIKKYVEASGKTSIGFFNNTIREFYKKAGVGIIIDGTSKTLYKDHEGVLHKDTWGGGDILYIEGKDRLIENILSKPDEPIYIFRPHW